MRIFGTRERSDSATPADLVAEIREFVRQQDFHADGQPSANNPASPLQQMVASPEQEIDVLIAELQALRERLQSEGACVQQCIANYATLNQSAMQSAKAISECLRDWRASTLRSSSLR
jgi:hypothetical protein